MNRRWSARWEKQNSLTAAQESFSNWMMANPINRAEVEWCRTALKLETLTAEQLRAIEFIVHSVCHPGDKKKP